MAAEEPNDEVSTGDVSTRNVSTRDVSGESPGGMGAVKRADEISLGRTCETITLP